MRIAVLANNYPALSEQFCRREVEALAALGHDIHVFTGWAVSGDAVDAPSTVPVSDWTDDNIRAFAPEVIYAEMGLVAHQRAFEVATRINVPFCLRVWQGYDSYSRPTPEFYREASAHRLCLGVIVEDEFNRRHATNAMQVAPEKIAVVPNSVDVERFCPSDEPRAEEPIKILSVSRLVAKKGLIHLVRAFNGIRAELGDNVELLIVGYGPEEQRLRAEAGSGVAFRGPVPAAELPALYQAADIFAAPCVQMPDGDADGIPTTVFEAMACGLPVVVSDLLSAGSCLPSHYLVPPGDETALAEQLRILVDHPEQRAARGHEGRAWMVGSFDIRTNIGRIESVLLAGIAS